MPKSKIAKYIKRHGLTLSAVAKKLGVSRQALANYGVNFNPTVGTLKKVADAMTALGAPTKIADLVEVFYNYNETTEK